jgi:hypothetical protein
MIARETARRIGAVSGLIMGILVMRMLGYNGIAESAIFGATFCVIGAITAEKLHGR